MRVRGPFRIKLPIYIIGLWIILISCGRGYEVTEIYGQKIKNTDKTIVKYQAWSTLNDGAKYQTTVLDENESINIRVIEQIPFDFLIGYPTKDTLFVLS